MRICPMIEPTGAGVQSKRGPGVGSSDNVPFVVALRKSQFHSSQGNGQKLVDSVHSKKKKKRKKKRENIKSFKTMTIL